MTYRVVTGNGAAIDVDGGPTANRAAWLAQQAHRPSPVYYDTDLDRIVYHDGITWRDPLTGASIQQ